MNLNVQAFMESFRFMGIGLLGIFVVMGVIIGTIVLLGRLTSKKEK